MYWSDVRRISIQSLLVHNFIVHSQPFLSTNHTYCQGRVVALCSILAQPAGGEKAIGPI